MLHAHSGLRLLLLLFLIAAIVKSLAGWLGKKPYGKSDNLIALLLLSFTHIQVLVGLALYFMRGWLNQISNMSDSSIRFWSLEHGMTMLIAAVLITVGRVKSKKADTDELKHKKGAIFYIIALILILWAGVIKPFALGRGWF